MKAIGGLLLLSLTSCVAGVGHQAAAALRSPSAVSTFGTVYGTVITEAEPLYISGPVERPKTARLPNPGLWIWFIPQDMAPGERGLPPMPETTDKDGTFAVRLSTGNYSFGIGGYPRPASTDELDENWSIGWQGTQHRLILGCAGCAGMPLPKAADMTVAVAAGGHVELDVRLVYLIRSAPP